MLAKKSWRLLDACWRVFLEGVGVLEALMLVDACFKLLDAFGCLRLIPQCVWLLRLLDAC